MVTGSNSTPATNFTFYASLDLSVHALTLLATALAETKGREAELDKKIGLRAAAW